jgi:hypothetical protein
VGGIKRGVKNMKVKLMERIGLWQLEDDVNDFIKNVRVLDIKYNTSVSNEIICHSAMIMYEDYVYKKGE